MKPTTLCLVIKEEKYVLLGRKKRGFGKGKWNGFGGKLEEGESFMDCAVRELYEECGLIVDPKELEPVGYLDFRFPYDEQLSHKNWVYCIRHWKGDVKETDEMEPKWFPIQDLPLHEMWSGDGHWLPAMLKGKKIVGYVSFGKDNESVEKMELKEVDNFE